LNHFLNLKNYYGKFHLKSLYKYYFIFILYRNINIMTQDQKAAEYDRLIIEADKVNRKLSKLKSDNLDINTMSDDYDKELNNLNRQMNGLEQEMQRLFV
tara:strand:- start:1292 stop:1588 length:297 start_codon:yes stop_codon:yes gene_type:complete